MIVMVDNESKDFKRVCLISQYFPPDIVGSGMRTFHIVKDMLSRGYEIVLVTGVPHYPDGNNKALCNRKLYQFQTKGRLTVIRLWMPPVSHHSTAGRMANYLYFMLASLLVLPLVGGNDLIMAMSPNFFVYPLGLLYKMCKRTPLIMNVDDLWPEALADLRIVRNNLTLRVLGAVRNSMLKMSDYVIPIAGAITRYLIRNGIPQDRIKTIEVGFDHSRFRRSDDDVAIPTNGAIRIIYAGALGPAYDFNLILNIAELAQERDKNWAFIVKGFGMTTSLLRRGIKARNLSNVQVFQKHMTNEEYANFMKTATVFILPMKDNFISTTAIPSKLLDFMAFGRPVLVLGKGQPAQLVKIAECGFSISQNQIEQAFDFIDGLEQTPLVGKLMGMRGKRYVESHLSLKCIGDKLETILSRLIMHRS